MKYVRVGGSRMTVLTTVSPATGVGSSLYTPGTGLTSPLITMLGSSVAFLDDAVAKLS